MVRPIVLMALSLGLVAGLQGCATAPSANNEGIDYGQYSRGSEHPAVLMLFDQADTALQAGNWSTALTYLDQARRIEPRNPYVLYRQAKAVAAGGDNERARQLLERAKVYANQDDEMINYLIYELEFQL